MRQHVLWCSLSWACLVTASCAFHKTADHWNGLVGPDGVPVHLDATTKIGFNLVVFVPFIGKTGIEGMVEEATKEIRQANGDFVRVVQGTSENYWYAMPPFTWVVTPVVHTLVVEYRPNAGPGRLLAPQSTIPPPDFRPLQSYNWHGADY